MFPIYRSCCLVELPFASCTTPASILNEILPPFSFLYLAFPPTIGFFGVNSVYPASLGAIFVSVNVYSYSSFAFTSTGSDNVFTIAVDTLLFTITFMLSFVRVNVLLAFVKYLSFTFSFITPVSTYFPNWVYYVNYFSTACSSWFVFTNCNCFCRTLIS